MGFGAILALIAMSGAIIAGSNNARKITEIKADAGQDVSNSNIFTDMFGLDNQSMLLPIMMMFMFMGNRNSSDDSDEDNDISIIINQDDDDDVEAQVT